MGLSAKVPDSPPDVAVLKVAEEVPVAPTAPCTLSAISNPVLEFDSNVSYRSVSAASGVTVALFEKFQYKWRSIVPALVVVTDGQLPAVPLVGNAAVADTFIGVFGSTPVYADMIPDAKLFPPVLANVIDAGSLPVAILM